MRAGCGSGAFAGAIHAGWIDADRQVDQTGNGASGDPHCRRYRARSSIKVWKAWTASSRSTMIPRCSYFDFTHYAIVGDCKADSACPDAQLTSYLGLRRKGTHERKI